MFKQRSPTNFKHLCHLDSPISWPVHQLYKEILSSTSVLQALYKAVVTEITLCCRHGVSVFTCSLRSHLFTYALALIKEPVQEYLILCIKSSDPSILSGLGRIWARCERSGSAGRGRGSERPDAAIDIIKFSVDRPKLRENGDKAIMECCYESLNLDQVADLLKIIHDVSPT